MEFRTFICETLKHIVRFCIQFHCCQMSSQLISFSLSSFNLTFAGRSTGISKMTLICNFISYFFMLCLFFFYLGSIFYLFLNMQIYFTALLFFRCFVRCFFFFLLFWFIHNYCRRIFKSNFRFSIWKCSFLFFVFHLCWRGLIFSTNFFDHLCLESRISC